MTTKEIVKGSFWLYFGTTLSLLLALFTSIVLARLLDKEYWGIFASAIAVVTIFSSLADLGFNHTIQYYASSLSAKKQLDKLKGYLGKLLKYKFLLILFIALIIFVFSDAISEAFHISGGGNYFKIASLLFIFFNFFPTLDAVMMGLQWFRESTFLSSIYYFTRLVFSVALVYFGMNVEGVLLGYIVAAIIAVVIQFFLLRNFVSFEMETKESITNLFSFGFLIGVAGIAMTITIWTDSIMIGIFLGATYVGVYKIAISVSTAAAGFIGTMNRVVFPVFAATEAKKGESVEDLNRIIKYGGFFAIPAVFGLAIAGEAVVNIFYGIQYNEAWIPLSLLSYFCFDVVVCGAINSFLAAKRKTSIIGKLAVGSAVANVFLNLLFIPTFGILGAAVASVVTRIGNFVGLIFECRKLNFGVKLSPLLKPFVGAVVMGLILLLLVRPMLIIKPLPALDGIFSLIFFVLTGMLVYVVFEYLIGFDIVPFVRKLFLILKM